jgi:DNA modification methylase
VKPDKVVTAKRGIVFKSAASLVPYARNTRTHSDEQIGKVMASIVEFGWTGPVLEDVKGIVAGHARTLGALRLYEQGKTIFMAPGEADGGEPLPPGTVPCLDVSGWSEAKRRAYIIADNALAAEAGWDAKLLKLELDDLTALDFNLDLLGFSADNLAAALGPAKGDDDGVKELLTDPDAVPEAPVDPVVVPGDVWLLGPHRLACGDATEAHVVEAVLKGAVPMLMVTDPPYGVAYDADWRTTATNGDGSLLSTGKDRATGEVLNDEREHWRDAWSLFPGDVVYVWASDRKGHRVAVDLEQCGFEIRAMVIWRKNQFVVSRGHYHPQHEPCIYAVRKGGKGHWSGDRKQSTVWDIDKPHKSETGHSTQKPVECMRRPMENNSSPGQAVFDPFVGSGTSIIAAEQIGRACYAIELNPRYCDVSILRWQDATGHTAKLEATGQTFVEAMAERTPDAVIRPLKKEKKKQGA